MSAAAGPPGARHPVLVAGQRPLWRTRVRRAGRAGLARFSAYLRSPKGRRVLLRGAGVAAIGLAGVGAAVLLRGWAIRLSDRLAALGTSWRTGAGAVGAGLRGARTAVSLRWLGGVARWLTRGAGLRRYQPCPECHARVRWDATVCYGCGYRLGDGRRLGEVARRRGALIGTLRWLGRVLVLSLYSPCPDCRRAVHADAVVCRRCGCRLER